jgi:hypothetical protein
MSFTAPTTKLPMAWNTPDSQLWDGAIPAAPDTAERARPRSESNWSRIWKPRPSSPETSPARLPTLLEALETAVCASTTAGVVEEAWGAWVAVLRLLLAVERLLCAVDRFPRAAVSCWDSERNWLCSGPSSPS